MDLEQRLARLERANLRMKRIGALVLLLAAVVLLSGQAKGKPRIVEAEKFVLRNDEGVWAELGLGEKGFVRLVLRDKRGNDRVFLGADPYGEVAGLTVRDRAGKSRVELIGWIGGAGLNLNDMEGKVRVRLYAAPAGEDVGEESLMALYAGKESERVAAAVKPDGTPQLRLKDKSGRVTWKKPWPSNARSNWLLVCRMLP